MRRIDSDGIQSILHKNRLTIFLVAVTPILAYALHQPFRSLPSLVDWKTITTLTGLLVVTTGIKESGALHFLADRLLNKIHDERSLALFLVFLSAILSMFVTNDVALFIVVPLTVTLQRFLHRQGVKLVVFEAIAVNVGSSLTPIGNPQNIYLWRHWGISFPIFVAEMLPLVAVMSLWLFLMTLFFFPAKKVRIVSNRTEPANWVLFAVSTVLLAAFVISIDVGYSIACLPVILFAVPALDRTVLAKCDWGLILLFIAVFLDVALLGRIGVVHSMLARPDLTDERVLFLSGALLSQLVSNVPSTLLLAKQSANMRVIAYAVNVAGNGLAIASFANLIALRLIDDKHKFRTFHFYSVSFFAATALSTLFLLL